MTDAQAFVDVVKMFGVVEAEIAYAAAERRTDRDLAALWSAHRSIEALLARSPRTVAIIPDYRPLGRNFHVALIESAHSRVFSDFGSRLYAAVQEAFLAGSPRQRAEAFPELAIASIERQHGEHFAMLRAIERNDPDAARAASAVHWDAIVVLLATLRAAA